MKKELYSPSPGEETWTGDSMRAMPMPIYSFVLTDITFIAKTMAVMPMFCRRRLGKEDRYKLEVFEKCQGPAACRMPHYTLHHGRALELAWQ